jgi:hypothetical protein
MYHTQGGGEMYMEFGQKTSWKETILKDLGIDGRIIL